MGWQSSLIRDCALTLIISTNQGTLIVAVSGLMGAAPSSLMSMIKKLRDPVAGADGVDQSLVRTGGGLPRPAGGGGAQLNFITAWPAADFTQFCSRADAAESYSSLPTTPRENFRSLKWIEPRENANRLPARRHPE
jgi:hypothetical protein